MANSAQSSAAADIYGVSAGLDLLSGVFGFLSSLNAGAMAQSRADLIRTEAEANAQRYSEQAAQHLAQEKVMYLASGVTLAGSPVDALATSARIANENMESIRMQGDREAANQESAGSEAESQGRAALVGGFAKGVGMGFNSYIAGHGGVDGNKDLAAAAAALGGK